MTLNEPARAGLAARCNVSVESGPELTVRFPGVTRAGEDETAALARVLAKEVNGGLVIILNGGLGAGKTVFTRALAEALGARGVKSPTFAAEMIHSLPGRDFNLIHADLYRFDSVPPGSDADLTLSEHLSERPRPLLVVEWGEKWTPPSNGRWNIDISHLDDGGDARLFVMSAYGADAAERLSRAYEEALGC